MSGERSDGARFSQPAAARAAAAAEPNKGGCALKKVGTSDESGK